MNFTSEHLIVLKATEREPRLIVGEQRDGVSKRHEKL